MACRWWKQTTKMTLHRHQKNGPDVVDVVHVVDVVAGWVCVLLCSVHRIANENIFTLYRTSYGSTNKTGACGTRPCSCTGTEATP